jgi:hypothetical protein
MDTITEKLPSPYTPKMTSGVDDSFGLEMDTTLVILKGKDNLKYFGIKGDNNTLQLVISEI